MKLLSRAALAATATVTIPLLSGCEPHTETRPEPEPTAWFQVNTAPYSYDSYEPVHQAFTTVATWRGWTPEEIEAWRPFIVDDLIRNESHGCYNVRAGGAVFASWDGAGCVLARNGRHQDAGFGQVVLRYNDWLCPQEGYCSPDEITVTAWDSMNAALAVIEHSGVGPWQYNAHALRVHPTLKYAPAERPNQN